MTRRAYLVIGCVIAANVVAAQTQDRTLSGTLTIKSAGRSTAVHGKSSDPTAAEFLFCIDQEAGAKPVTFSGEGRVIYRPTPVAGIPESVARQSPEQIAPVLTVVTSTGETWLFVAKGQTALQPPTGNARTTTIPVNMVRRTDWSTGTGPRRGTDISSCLMTAG